MGIIAVAAGAPDFLHVIFQGLGQVVMVDGADVRLVDSHAESNGSDDHVQIVGHEGILHFRPLFGFQARVIGPGPNPFVGKKCGDLLGGFLQGDVDNGRFDRSLPEALQQLLTALRGRAGRNGQVQVGR